MIGSPDFQITSELDIHPPQVAGSFYPARKDQLLSLIHTLAQKALPPCIAPKIIIIPHAGIDFSGIPAATSVLPLVYRRPSPKRIVILGPAHRYAFEGVAIHPAKTWRTPLGDVPTVCDLAAKIPEVRLLPEAFQNEHAIELPLLILQALLKEPFEIVPILIGKCTTERVATVLQKLWGGPETVIAVSSDLSHFLDLKACESLDRATAARIETLQGTSLTGEHACGFRALAGAIEVAAHKDMRVTTLQLTNSAAVSGNPQRVVGYGSFGFEYAASARLTDEHRHFLLNTAMVALAEASKRGGNAGNVLATGPLSPILTAHRATFVTLSVNDKLRGCVGSVTPHRPLAGDIFFNAIKAGFEDRRFSSLTHDDLSELTVTISILSHKREIHITEEKELIQALEPDRDGLILQDGEKNALFLPSVWSSLPEPLHFIRQLKAKAQLPLDNWFPTIKAYRFRTESFSAPFRHLDKSSIAPLILQ